MLWLLKARVASRRPLEPPSSFSVGGAMRGGGALAITDPKEPREGDGLGLARGSGLGLE